MNNEIVNKLDQGFDEILFQLSKGNTIEGLKKGKLWMGFEQIKECVCSPKIDYSKVDYFF